jgi:hypothetical protein
MRAGGFLGSFHIFEFQRIYLLGNRVNKRRTASSRNLLSLCHRIHKNLPLCLIVSFLYYLGKGRQNSEHDHI